MERHYVGSGQRGRRRPALAAGAFTLLGAYLWAACTAAPGDAQRAPAGSMAFASLGSVSLALRADAATGAPDATGGTPDATAGAPDATAGAPDAATGAPDATGGTPDAAPAGDCCTPRGAPGCGDAVTLACLCAADAFCCEAAYDERCVSEAVSLCGLECAPPPTSDCCSESAAPGCTDPELRACVCDVDPACCALRFDENCVSLAEARCGAVCGAGEAAP